MAVGKEQRFRRRALNEVRWQALHAKENNMEEQEQPKLTEQKNDQQQPDEGKETEKTFTRDELGKIVKAQLADERKKWEQDKKKELDDAIAKAKEDGKAEAGMDAKQLAEKEAKDREDKLKQQEADLAKRQAELDRRDHIAHTKDLLAADSLPTSAAEMLLGETEEETKANIEAYKALVAQGVRNELHRSSAGKAPQNGAPAQPQAPHKDMSEMTYEEMQKYLESQNQ
ncbi:capsid assembly scaffolding protein Gp46 family protein [Limosilactobacillus reuteri]|uniref:capsid assembly scaffolding protein Gp46 family protein n=1 Tax=Limosilactobacillus reuteri TaxID=1598 RepID=UPI001EE6FBA3|nr:DUF4355 domain-containing protein [Limosilactobacillus reuteri]